MESTAKVLALITGGLIICVMVMMIIAGFFYPAGFSVLGIVPESTYSYDVTIEASSDITGATFFLPLPSLDEKSSVGVSIIDGKGYGLGEGIDAELFGAKDAMMLKVTADGLKSAQFGGKSYEDHLIDTQSPVENSYLLSPVMKLSEGDNTAQYETYVYAKYGASPDCDVTVKITAEGRNAWQFFTPKMNYYTNEMILKLKGPQSGWQTAGVDVSCGNGDYTLVI